jgi:hypothetical protein
MSFRGQNDIVVSNLAQNPRRRYRTRHQAREWQRTADNCSWHDPGYASVRIPEQKLPQNMVSTKLDTISGFVAEFRSGCGQNGPHMPLRCRHPDLRTIPLLPGIV